MLCLLVSIVQLIQWSQDPKGVIVPTNFRSLSVTLFSLSNTCSVLFVFSVTDFPWCQWESEIINLYESNVVSYIMLKTAQGKQGVIKTKNSLTLAND